MISIYADNQAWPVAILVLLVQRHQLELPY